MINLEWTYTPRDYFDAPVNIKNSDYSIEIDSGRIIATINDEYFDTHPEIRGIISGHLNDYFLAASFNTYKPFSIRSGGFTRVFEDGHKEITLNIHDTVSLQTSETVDLVQFDKNGKIVRDTKQERLDTTSRITEYCLAHISNDVTARHLFECLRRAINHPEHELIHLYEIRDVLDNKFNNGKTACQTLDIGYDNYYRRLGQLANSEPLNQGRHSGEHAGKLRDATKEELEEVRNIARKMIRAYLEYLDGT